MLTLTSAAEEEIASIAEDAYPHECCGFLIGIVDDEVKEVAEIRAALNENSDSPRNRYLITPEAVLAVEKDLRGRDLQIIGFFHSHPDAPSRPSEFDREHAWPWYAYLILSVKKGERETLSGWRLRDDRSAFQAETVRIV